MALVPSNGSALVPSSATPSASNALVPQGHYDLAMTQNANAHNSLQNITNNLGQAVQGFLGQQSQQNQVAQNNAWFNNLPQQHQNQLVPVNFQPVNTSQLVPSGWENIYNNQGQMVPSNPQNQGQIVPSTPVQQQNQGQVGFPNQEQGQIVPSETQPTQSQQPEQPTTENPAQEVVPSNPTQGTSAPRPTTLNLGSRTRKIKRKHGLRIQADGVIPDDEFNMDMIKLCEPCPDSGGHEQNCGRHAQKIIKQYEAMEFRTEIFDYMVKNKDNMTDGFVCTILNMENTFICENKEMYELYREMRETRGMNKHYGTPNFEHINFSNNTCMAEVHTSCICAQMFENRGHCKECFVQWIEKVCMVALIFPLHHQLTRRMRKLARKQTRQNSFARQLQYVSVEAFCALDSLTFMNVSAPHLIAVRDELGVNKPNDEPWFAQADGIKPTDETPTSWLEWLGFTTAIDWAKATLDNVKDLVKSAFEKLIKSMCDAATWARNLLSQWKERLVRILIDSFLEPTRQCFSLLLKKSVMALIGVICCLLLCFFGFITWDKICAFLGLGLDCLMTAKDCVMNIVTKIFEVKSEDILRYCKNAVIITSGLGAAFTVSSKIFGLLPFAIQAAVIDKVGTKGQKDRLMIDEWKARAYSILTVTRIPRIVSSKYYHEKLNEINEEGFRLLKYVERDRKLEVLQLYCRVQAAWTNLVVKHEAAKQRDLPFSIHISGAPGVGKTVMTSKLIESLGYTTKDVYYRPPASEFWDGFIGAKVVIYDEFLINSDTANQMATEYLNLVSIAPFSPPLASTDNIAVGVKGTTARPELVITINNAPCYAPPSLMSRDALLRRRNIVLQLNKNAALFQKYQADIMGNAPMVQMTKEEVDDAHWVNATLLDPMTGSPITQPMRIKTAFKVIGTYHETHEVVNMRLLADERADLTPDEIFQQVMKLHCGVPTQKFSLMAFLKDKVGSWVAQGKKSRPPKNQREAMKAEAKKEFENLQTQPHQTVPQGTQPDDVRDLMEAIPPQPLPSYPQGMIMPNQYYQSGVASYVASVAGLRDAPRTHAYGYETIVNNEFGPPGSSTGSYLTHMTTPSHVHSEPGYVHRAYPMKINPNDPRFQNCVTASDTEMDPKTAMVVNQREDLIIETENGMFIYDPHDTPPFHDARSPTHHSSPQLPEFNEQDQELDARIKALEPITEEMVIDEAEKLQTSSQAISKWLFDAIHCTAIATFSWTKECGIWFIEGVKKEPTTWFLMGWLIFLGYIISRVINHAVESDARITDAVVDYYSIPREAQDSHSTSKTTTRARKRNVVRGSRWESQAQATMLGEIVISSGLETVNQYFVNIGKRWALTTAHIWDCMTAVNKVTLTYRGVNYSFELKDTDVALDLENDLGLFRVPHNNFPNTKDMTNRFATFDEITSINTLSATIERGNGTIFVMAKLMDGWVYSSFKNTQQPQKMFIYSGRFEGGDCGAILRSADTIASGKIIGIHVCGSTSVNVPKGGSTTICVSDVQSLKEAFGVVDADTDDTFVSQGNICTAPIEPFKYPRTNLINISAVSPDDIVHFPVRSKITPSLIYGKLPVESEKQPSVMSSQDSRTSANPDENFKQRISQINRSQIDPIKLHAICATMIKNFKQNFVKKLAPRELTMEEAIGGIPGYLSSLKISTSPGFPVCKMLTARGKTACFMIYPEGKIEIEPWFRTAVEHRLDEMKRGVKPRNRFLVYFKDELVSRSKVEEARTRAIYCNDVVSLVAFRMRYGVTLAEFNNSNLSISSAVGLNQYSTDMHSIFHYLTCTGNRKFIAGDYKNFDTTYNRQIHKAAYDIFFALNEITSETENEYVWRHEGEEPLLQFKQELLRVFCMHTSGCFLTTVINCIVNEIYFRYIFMTKYPSKSFDKECRLKVLGDDHILSISDRVELNPLEIQSLMANIGLTYTSDRKDEDLTAEYRSFEEITFLGAHPRLIRVEGMMTYVGAPKQQMLWQSIQWTKTNNNDLMDVIEANLYLASLWDKDFFRNYYLSIKEAITNEGFAFDLKIPSYEEMQQIAATRNAASGETWFRAQGRIGLTQVVDENVAPPSTNLDVPLIFGNSGIQELPGTLDLGSDSLIHRFDLEWKITSKAGDTLIDVACPFDMLKYGQLENLQNMPFDRYLYARCDTEVVVQIAGTPFHQGALLVNIIPLDIDFAINANNATGYRYGTPVSSLTFFNHVILSPNTSTTATMKQPFIYFKDWLNTRLADNYCRFKLSVLSQLQVGDGGATSVSVSVFSRFPNLKVSVPRPQTSKSDKLPGTMLLVKPEPPTDDGTPEPERWVAQGNHISTNNNYNISNVAGSVPIGTSNQASAVNTPSTNIQANPNVSAIPMDNPPMCSGSIPVYSVFPSKAKTVGISTAVSLGHHPEEMHRQGHQMAAMNNDMSVEAYCARPTLLGRFMWSTTLNTSDVIFSVPFNSLLAWSSGFRRDTASWIPSCCYPLNIAQFWRADFNFTFMAVMSDFHSGRLRATVAYGCAPYSKLHNTIYRNEILDFTSGSEVATVKVPFNAPTEYLCSFSIACNKPEEELLEVQEFGSLQVSVANALKCPATVAQSVEVLVFVTCCNVKLREVRSFTPERPAYIKQHVKDDDPTPTEYETFVAQANTTTVVVKEEERIEDFTTRTDVTVDDQRPPPVPQPCRLNIGEKFEYTWNNFGEIYRRYVQVAYLYKSTADAEMEIIPIFPSLLREVFGFWSGHLQFRIIAKASGNELPEITATYRFPKFSDKSSADKKTITGSCAIAIRKYKIPKSQTSPAKTISRRIVDNALFAPVENLYPLSNGWFYIDVRVPFNTQYNFLPVTEKGDVGMIKFFPSMPFVFNVVGMNTTDTFLYMKASDDCRFFLPRPVNTIFPVGRSDVEASGGFVRVDLK